MHCKTALCRTAGDLPRQKEAKTARHGCSHAPPSSSTMTGGSSLWADAIAADAAAALLGFTTKCPATVAATLSRLLLSPFCSVKCISVASRGAKPWL
jgi:hypothetical protein